MPTKDSAMRVFLSYSRKEDRELSEIADSLAARGFLPDFDLSTYDPEQIESGISAEDEWWLRLEQMISAADAVVFLVSPASTASKICDEEINFARSLGKRIIPVLVKPVDFTELPPRLAALNIKIDLSGDRHPSAAGMKELCRALDRDVSWLRHGKQIQSQANEWSQAGRAEYLLLRGKAIDAASKWAERRPRSEPEPGELLLEFLDESRKVERRDDLMRRSVVQRGFAAGIQNSGTTDAAFRRLAAAAILSEDPELSIDGLASEPNRNVLWRSALLVENDRLRQVLHGRDHALSLASFSSDGTRLLAASDDNVALIWELRTGKKVAELEGHKFPLKVARFSPDGDRAITISNDPKPPWDDDWSFEPPILWDVRNGCSYSQLIGHAGGVTDAVFSPDSALVATKSFDQTIRLWDTKEAQHVGTIQALDSYFETMVFSPSSGQLATGSNDGTVHIWDAATCNVVLNLKGHDIAVEKLHFTSDGRLLLASTLHSHKGEQLQVWDIDNGRELSELRQQEAFYGASSSPLRILIARTSSPPRVTDFSEQITLGHPTRLEEALSAASFSQDGARVVTLSRDGVARLWDAIEGKQLADLRGHAGAVTSVAFSPDSRSVATSSKDGTVRIWEAARSTLKSKISGTGTVLGQAVISPDSSTIVVTNEAATKTRFWSVGDGSEKASLDLAIRGLSKDAFSPDGSKLVGLVQDDITADRFLRVWCTDDGSEAIPVLGPELDIRMTFFCPSGERIIGLATDGVVHVWDAFTGAERSRLEGHAGRVEFAQFSPNGSVIATASADGTARLWDAQSGHQLAAFDHGSEAVGSINFSPDGNHVVTAEKRKARLWDCSSGEQVASFSENTELRGATFLPDGTRILTTGSLIGSGPGTMETKSSPKTWLWDINSCQKLAEFEGAAAIFGGRAFTPDGRRLITVRAERWVSIWDTDNGFELQRLDGMDMGDLGHAEFTPDGRCALTRSTAGFAQLWDVSRTSILVGDRGIILAAKLDNGLGQRTIAERQDLMMETAPDDLFSAYLNALVAQRLQEDNETEEVLVSSIGEAISTLSEEMRAPLDKLCYEPLSPKCVIKTPGISGTSGIAELNHVKRKRWLLWFSPNS